MAFERDFCERFKDDGRSALLKYHRNLKQVNLDMGPVVAELIATTTNKAGDQRFTQHFVLQAQREEHNLMCLIAPPDRADYELLSLTPEMAAQVYGIYAAFNEARRDQLKPTAPPEVLDHLARVTNHLKDLEENARASTTRVSVPLAFLNLAYDSVLAETDPPGYERAMMRKP